MRHFLIFSLILLSLPGLAQNKVWVYLADKDTAGYNPFSFFDQKAIERRIQNHIPIFDITDVPVNENYITILEGMSDSLTYASRWFNAVCLYADNQQLEQISALPFVLRTEPADDGYFTVAEADTTSMTGDEWLQEKQLSIMQGEKFREAGITGKGVRIAIFDGGFPNVDVLPCFKHIRDNNRIIRTWDFTRKKENVYGFSSHGTSVMCCIAGIDTAGKPFGLATDAEFLLARTEVNAEPFSEEENWIAALEWADQNGADIVNSSLGYTFNRYFPYQMDGKTSFVSRGAAKAASKGILVVNAAGNEGEKTTWEIIGAPADADSILSVGGVDPENGLHISFSSYGPTADGRLKPNVCAAGKVFAYGRKSTSTIYGTSFASPITAGFAACAKQARPGINAWDLLQEIQKSGHLYPYFDYAHGYGIPQASYFTRPASDTGAVYFEILIESGNAKVSILQKPEGLLDYLYVQCWNPDGKMSWYRVLSVDAEKIDIGYFTKGQRLTLHYRNQTESVTF